MKKAKKRRRVKANTAHVKDDLGKTIWFLLMFFPREERP